MSDTLKKTSKEHTGAEITAPVRTGDTVVVGNKLTHTLSLQLHEMVEQTEPNSGRTIKVARRIGDPVVIRGSAVKHNTSAEFPIVGGYALTFGIDKDFWDRWTAENADLDILKKGLVFAQDNNSRTEGQAREQKDLRTGFERLVQQKSSKAA
jgi:hypothetical protein